MNRFNKYVNVDYVGLPINAYQMVASAKEGEYQAHLDNDREQYNALNAVEAMANPDRMLKDKLISGINDRVQALGSKNLKSADALMELNKIVNDPSTVEKLAQIYGNTVNIKEKNAADQKYLDEYGNDINIAQGNDQLDAYNRQGIEGFKPGMFSGYSPGKYVDIVGDAQKLLKDSKGNSYVKQWTANGWRYIGEKEELTEEGLMRKAMPLFTDPKYKSQIRNLEYYGLRKYGGAQNPQAAILNYNNQYATGLSDQLAVLSKQLSEYEKKVQTNPRQGYEKAIEGTRAAIAQLKQERDQALGDQTGEVYSRNMMTALGRAAISPYTYEKNKLSDEVDAYALAGYKSRLALGNTLAAMKKAHEYKKEEESQKIREQGLPEPETTSVIAGVNPDGSQNIVSGVMLTAKGGYDGAKINNTILGILGNAANAYGPDNKLIDLNKKLTGVTNSPIAREQLAKEIKAGTATIQIVGRTGEYSIVSPTQGVVRINMDDQLKNDPGIANLKKLGDMKQDQDLQPMTFSLDGKTLSSVLVKKEKNGALMYQPATPFLATGSIVKGYNDAYHNYFNHPKDAAVKQALINEMRKVKALFADPQKGFGIKLTDDALHEIFSPSVGQEDVIMIKPSGVAIINPSGEDIANYPNSRIIQFEKMGPGGSSKNPSQQRLTNKMRIMSPVYMNHGDLDKLQVQFASRENGPLGAMNAKKVKITSDVSRSSSEGSGQSEYERIPVDVPE